MSNKKKNKKKNKKGVDIKYLGVPNVCFSLTSKDDKRDKKYSKQRIERGFDDSETWSLTDTVANFMIPRLERFIEIKTEMFVLDKKHVKDLNTLLEALKLIVRDDGIQLFDEKEKKIVKKGLKILPEVFMTLWW